jgi:hypothetical protein
MIEFIKIIFFFKENNIKSSDKKNLAIMKASFTFTQTFIVIFSFFLPLAFTHFYNTNEKQITELKHDTETRILKYDINIAKYESKLSLIKNNLFDVSKRYISFD